MTSSLLFALIMTNSYDFEKYLTSGACLGTDYSGWHLLGLELLEPVEGRAILRVVLQNWILGPLGLLVGNQNWALAARSSGATNLVGTGNPLYLGKYLYLHREGSSR